MGAATDTEPLVARHPRRQDPLQLSFLFFFYLCLSVFSVVSLPLKFLASLNFEWDFSSMHSWINFVVLFIYPLMSCGLNV